MKPSTYRDMHLLTEVEQSPDITQRALAGRIGVALGLTNLMLRRLAKKGYIKLINTQRNRIRYLITPTGILEKTRLTYEYIHYSLQLYGGVRHFLRERLGTLAQAGHRQILLCGSDEMAEIAFLTAREMGLTVVGVVDLAPTHRPFLGYPVQDLGAVTSFAQDPVVVTALREQAAVVQALVERGVAPERIISFPQTGTKPAEATSAAAVPLPAAPGLVPADTEVVILCGGRGTRLGALTDETPKPLLPVGERPFLLHLLLRLKQEGFRRFILAVHYRAEQFEAFRAASTDRFPNLEVIVEPEPLGTGGALRHAAETVHSATFLALNGDSWVSQPLAPVLGEHERFKRGCTMVGVAASQVEGGALKKGVWRLGPSGEILDFTTPEAVADGWVNAGVYVLERALVLSWPKGAYSLEENLATLLSGRSAGVFCSPARLLDIGMAETYAGAARAMESADPLAAAASSP